MRHGLLAITSTCALACALLVGTSNAQYIPIDATGLVPLNDLGHDTYAGEQGGLYPMGVNMRPPAHDLAGLAAGASIEPLDIHGNPDPVNGRVVMLTSGMSNAGLIALRFKKLSDLDPLRAANVVIASGSHAGKTAELMSDPDNPFWTWLRKDLEKVGATRQQVQVVWLLQTQKNQGVPFPQHAESLADQLETITQLMKEYFPNLKLMYFSSRIYGGHDGSGKSPEPHAYESGFGVKWLIERQIQGKASLNYDPAKGPVLAPWLAWGPYLWADGTIERGDGMTWLPEDIGPDGLHPSRIGSFKAGQKIVEFLQTDATARSWYVRQPGQLCPMQADASLFGFSEPVLPTAPRLTASMLPTAGAPQPLKLYARGAPAGASGWFLVGDPTPGGQPVPVAGGSVFIDLTTARLEAVTTNAIGQAWLNLGQLPEPDEVVCGAVMYAQFVVWNGQAYDFSRPVSLRIGH
ncbi:MAG: hypothetical protein ACYTG2_09575 [Planctomycetota bacterium]|jgi:hypothetical protein